MPRTSKNSTSGSSSRQRQNKNSLQSRSGSGRSSTLRNVSGNEGASTPRTRGDSRPEGFRQDEPYSSSRGPGGQLETGFHNEHYRAGFDAGRAYYHHYERDRDSGESQRRAGGSERWASDSNLNGPRDDYSRSSGRGRDSDRWGGGDYGESVYRSDNENYGAGQHGDGNLGRSRNDFEDADTDGEESGRSASSPRDQGSQSSGRTNRGSRSRGSARSVRADESES